MKIHSVNILKNKKNMITVRSKQELEVALKNKTALVRIEGPYAKKFANAVLGERRPK